MHAPMDDLSPEEKELLKEAGASFESLGAHHADCPRVEILLASQAGTLPEEAARGVTAHLEKCSFCQILLKDLSTYELTSPTPEETKRVRERVAQGTKPDTKKAKAGGGFLATWLWKAIPVTALAGAAIILLLWTRLHPTNPVVVPPAATIQPATKPPAISPLQWEKSPIRLQAESILVFRGKPRTAQERYASELTPALVFYKNDNFAEAAEQLGKVAQDFPRGVEGQLYLGISDLKLERNADAIEPLQAAQKLGPQPFRDDATWYLALAYQRTQDRVGAVAELKKLCQGKGDYAARACTAAKELAAP